MLRSVSLALLLAVACSTLPNPTQTTVQPKLSSIQAAIFTPSCAVSGCHDATTQSGNLVLTASVAYANLVGVPVYEVSPLKAGDGGYVPLGGGKVQESLCEDATTVDTGIPLRVDPGNPGESYLIWKLTAKTSDGGAIEQDTYCSQMPKINMETLTTAQISAIQTWIQNGAAND